MPKHLTSNHSHHLAQVIGEHLARANNPKDIQSLLSDRRFDAPAFVLVLQQGKASHQHDLLHHVLDHIQHPMCQNILTTYLVEGINSKRSYIKSLIKTIHNKQHLSPLALQSILDILFKSFCRSSASDQDIQTYLVQIKPLLQAPHAFVDLHPLFMRCVQGKPHQHNDALFFTILDMQHVERHQLLRLLWMVLQHDKRQQGAMLMRRMDKDVDLSTIFSHDVEMVKKSIHLWRPQDLDGIVAALFSKSASGRQGVDDLKNIYHLLEHNDLFSSVVWEQYHKHCEKLNADDQTDFRQWLAGKQRQAIMEAVGGQIDEASAKERRKI